MEEPFRSSLAEGISENLDLTGIVKAIHDRVKRARSVKADTGPPYGFESWQANLLALRQAYKYLYEIRASVGRMPPNPGTLRARLSAHVIALLRKALFWYTPSIIEFNSASAAVIDRLCSLHELEHRNFRALSEQIDSLRLRLRALALGAPNGPPALPGAFSVSRVDAPDAELVSFLFALQDQFRGPEVEVRQKLHRYIQEIKSARPEPPAAPWVDLGSGRGEWLAIASEAGFQVTGVDLSVEAVGHCRSKGLHVENQNALSYLRHLPDATLGVITAFHFLEHCPFEMIFFIVREAARTLKPGGLFILEVPNPANSLPAAYEFWRDPTHIRPLPMDLLCFLFQHHGFKQEKILYRNPVDEGQRLPFDQLEFINQLNSLLYGARDYGLIARR